MKTAADPRHKQRIKVMQDLFAWDFHKKDHPETQTGQEIASNLKIIDKSIAEAAPAWPLEKINKIDLAILRQSVFELLTPPKEKLELTPPKVVVDEAVELAKEFGSESSPAFVNGVLGKVIQDNQIKV
ncbi:MAG: N utilization substance protein B-like protein [Candidatus Daviesbacteria bacterium GW2011_GWA2_38_24]|uniref:N utilization substance protein B-like protein n=1 Tax=Candidatus Daviesbacteria bacterium GW2011_GWA2_38_24 TaxID=1618422 RepID=A0A0G0LYG2_9BACT|nr:MAG: N utilization substance protein B-like protein [Candidatus Daviesbacteria bacterium GW2011_GWA2_38_24]KKQ79617.1 MAG: N utilization substance protein B-like protein [Candidatus Daviesbacteria bacterium GW2011_GWA1_38_7]OGE24181.1 MAG: hypothetical protein A2688_02535 [Candidatus Daviesbacteria bacterium RIFCSPHIGHO2_01_FULL_38_8]